MSITVLDPGPLTTVPDAAVWAMLPRATAAAAQRTDTPTVWAILLVGNDPGAAVLECTLRGDPCGLKRTPSLL